MTATSTPKPVAQDMNMAQAALAALQRAGLRAAEEARRTHTLMVIAENDQLLHISPQDYLGTQSEKTNSDPSKLAQ